MIAGGVVVWEVVPDPHLDVDGRLFEGPDALGAGQLLHILPGDAENFVALSQTPRPTSFRPGRGRTLGAALKSKAH